MKRIVIASDSGFTLIELLIVLVTLSVFFSTLYGMYGSTWAIYRADNLRMTINSQISDVFDLVRADFQGSVSQTIDSGNRSLLLKTASGSIVYAFSGNGVTRTINSSTAEETGTGSQLAHYPMKVSMKEIPGGLVLTLRCKERGLSGSVLVDRSTALIRRVTS